MDEFLNKLVYIHIEIQGRHFYYTQALITSVTETHISFFDDYDKPCTYRKADVVEIKLSNKEVENGKRS